MKRTLSILVIIVGFVMFACKDNSVVRPSDGKEITHYYVTIQQSDPDAKIYANVEPSAIELTASVESNIGTYEPGVSIVWRTTIGSIINSSITDENGESNVLLRSHGYFGKALVTAGVNGSSHSIYVNIQDDPPADTMFVSIVDSLALRNSTIIQVTSILTEYNTPVLDGTSAVFRTDLGNFQLADGTNTGQSFQDLIYDGECEAIFFAGYFETGIATIEIKIDDFVYEHKITIIE